MTEFFFPSSGWGAARNTAVCRGATEATLPLLEKTRQTSILLLVAPVRQMRNRFSELRGVSAVSCEFTVMGRRQNSHLGQGARQANKVVDPGATDKGKNQKNPWTIH